MMTLLFAVAIGLATATTALVARRVGEGDLEGAAEVAVQSLALGLLVSLVIGGGGALGARRLLAAMGASGEVLAVGTLFLAAPRPLVRLFTADPEVLAVAVECLRWLGASYGFFALGLVALQAFNGAGDTATPMRLKFLCYWLWQIPAAWLLSVEAGLGPRGVFAAIASAEVLLAASALVLFRRGRWKEKVV